MKLKCIPIVGTLNGEMRDFLLADLTNVFHIEKFSFLQTIQHQQTTKIQSFYGI